MKIGIGLPSALPGAPASSIIDWAIRAERAGFSSVAAIDRIVYPNYDPLTALTAAAAVTERVSLCTSILLAPLRANHAQFAREAASIDAISNGRLILGLGAGSRPDDYEISGVQFERRGRLFDELLDTATSIWRGESGEIGPKPARPGGPVLLFGGESAPALRRAARYGAGWIAGGGRVDDLAEQIHRVGEVFAAAGRTDPPRVMKLGYFALGPEAEQFARQFFVSYYGARGEERLQRALRGCFRSEAAIRDAAAQCEAAGCEELILAPTNHDPEQITALAGVLNLS